MQNQVVSVGVESWRILDITGRRQNVLEQAVQAHSTGLRGSLVAIQADVTSKEDLKHISESIVEKKIHILIK